MFFAHFTERPKPVVDVDPDRRVFRGETVTLTCDIQQTGDWWYSWNEPSRQVYSAGHNQKYTITSVDWSHGGVYSCIGTLSTGYSQHSAGVTLTVSGESSCVLHTESFFFHNSVIVCSLELQLQWCFCLETEKNVT